MRERPYSTLQVLSVTGIEKYLVSKEQNWTDAVGLRIRGGFLEEEAVGWALKDE